MHSAETPSLGGRAWFVGDLTPEELDEIGPPPAPLPRPGWSHEEYRAQMLRRGVRETRDESALGVDRYLALAEAWGVLEKRPNTVWIIGGDGFCRPFWSDAV